MPSENTVEIIGAVLDEDSELSLSDLCRACGMPAEHVMALVEEGIIEPRGAGGAQLKFSGICVRRVRRVYRLERDLGVNLAGAALTIELLEEIERLQARLSRLEGKQR